MRAGRIVGLILLAMALGVSVAIADWLIGWRPRFGQEAEFQRIINEAQVVDYYRGAEAGGWDRQDVTGEICDHVDADILNGLEIEVDERTSWPTQTGWGSKPMDIWRIMQDKGALASCRDRSHRYLSIEIDRETLGCKAFVSVLPSCDL